MHWREDKMQIWYFSMQAVVTSPLHNLQSFLEVQCKVGQNFPCPATPFLFLWKCSNINEEDKNMMCICLREHERNKFLTIYLLCHASSYSINGKSFHTSCLPPNPLSHGICLENGKLASTLLFSQCFMWHCRLHYSRVRHASPGTVPNKHSNWFFVGKPANSKSLFGTFRCKQAVIFQLWNIFFLVRVGLSEMPAE